MIVEIKIPELGESVSYAELATWLVKDGDIIDKDQEIAEIDSDKATLALPSEVSGKISIKVKEGSKVKVGEVIATVDTSHATEKKPQAEAPAPSTTEKEKEPSPKPIEKEKEVTVQEPKAETESPAIPGDIKVSISPVAERIMKEKNISAEEVLQHKLLRITKEDVQAFVHTPKPEKRAVDRTEKREELSPLRKKLAERLVKAKNETAMLTTFNEVDLSAVIEIRKKYQKAFTEKHGIKLGFMSFFTRAVVLALDEFPAINARLDGDELIYFHYKDIGIAVSTPKGLMVPVVRNAETLSMAEIEKQIAFLAEKARNKRLSLEEMSGGTFTITNGGVFGSLLSTPIINPPQVGVLGMHSIQERPVAVNGQVHIRPMMYLALSYDHRVIDGKESVSFLVKIKELLENPSLLLTGQDHIAALLEL